MEMISIKRYNDQIDKIEIVMASRNTNAKSSKTAKKAPKPKTEKIGAEEAVIDGVAEEITDQADTAHSKPTSHQRPKPKKIPLSAFAIVLATIALGIAIWTVTLIQADPYQSWRQQIDTRLTALENIEFKDAHLARKTQVDTMVMALNDLSGQINDMKTALRQLKDYPPVVNESVDTTNVDQPSASLINEIKRLQTQIDKIKTEIDHLKKMNAEIMPLTQNITATDQNANDQENPLEANSSSWWDTFIGSIKITRIDQPRPKAE